MLSSCTEGSCVDLLASGFVGVCGAVASVTVKKRVKMAVLRISFSSTLNFQALQSGIKFRSSVSSYPYIGTLSTIQLAVTFLLSTSELSCIGRTRRLR